MRAKRLEQWSIVKLFGIAGFSKQEVVDSEKLVKLSVRNALSEPCTVPGLPDAVGISVLDPNSRTAHCDAGTVADTRPRPPWHVLYDP